MSVGFRRAARLKGRGVEQPDRPADLKHCAECGKLIGTPETKGWFEPECQCDVDLTRSGPSHSIKSSKTPV